MNAIEIRENESVIRIGERALDAPFYHDIQVDGWDIYNGTVIAEGGLMAHPWNDESILGYAKRLTAWRRRERLRRVLSFLASLQKPARRNFSVTNNIVSNAEPVGARGDA